MQQEQDLKSRQDVLEDERVGFIIPIEQIEKSNFNDLPFVDSDVILNQVLINTQSILNKNGFKTQQQCKLDKDKVSDYILTQFGAKLIDTSIKSLFHDIPLFEQSIDTSQSQQITNIQILNIFQETEQKGANSPLYEKWKKRGEIPFIKQGKFRRDVQLQFKSIIQERLGSEVADSVIIQFSQIYQWFDYSSHKALKKSI